MNKKLNTSVAVDFEQSFWLGRIEQARRQAAPPDVGPPESRQSVRRSCNFEAVLRHSQGRVVPRRLRGLSLKGAFVELDAGVALTEGMEVELVLQHHRYGRIKEFPLSATVARVEARGAALSFVNYDNYLYTELVDLLYTS